jgi:hypothetical protein
MRRLRWFTLVWPGLPQLWFAGSWVGLALAAGFATVLNLGIVTSRLWTELLSPESQTLIWLAIGGIWIASAALSVRWVAGLRTSGPQAVDEDLFNAAQNEYLKGNWYEAEVALNRLLDRNILDVAARLMLASLLRRTGRRDEAATQLARLSRTDGAERWHLEIGRLKQRLADDASEPANDSPVAVDESDVATKSNVSIDEEPVSQAA